MSFPDPARMVPARQALAQGDLPLATQILERQVELSPNDADTQAMLGMAYRQIGGSAEALQHLRVASGLKPQDAELLLELGVALEDAGDLPGAGSGLS